MYKGFNVQLELRKDHPHYNEWVDIGKQLFDAHSMIARTSLDSFVLKENMLDGGSIQKAWFPSVKADIFLSYSHDDLNHAYAFAGNIYKNFKLTTFIDSAIWGYSDDLLRLLDTNHCHIPHTTFFDYEKRNRSTAHVHMMLSTALTMMMNRTECIFFLNTPNSIQTFNGENKTSSPWLYAENVATQTLKCNFPDRLKRTVTESYGFDGSEHRSGPEILYPMDIGHLDTLTSDMFNSWCNMSGSGIGHKLDLLYSIVQSMKTANV